MDDHSIVNFIYERDDRGLKALQDKYGKSLLRICGNFIGKEDSEECVNDVYLLIWDSIPPQRPENLFGFAAAIARRRAVSRLRRNTAAKRGKNADLLLSELEDCLPSGQTVEQSFDALEMSRMINDYLSGIKPRERKIFVLRYFGGESMNSIANKMCMTPVAVRTMLSRLREKLKPHLEKGGIEL